MSFLLKTVTTCAIVCETKSALTRGKVHVDDKVAENLGGFHEGNSGWKTSLLAGAKTKLSVPK
jgi:hypothetical protein